jgi:hypothetical protein
MSRQSFDHPIQRCRVSRLVQCGVGQCDATFLPSLHQYEKSDPSRQLLEAGESLALKQPAELKAVAQTNGVGEGIRGSRRAVQLGEVLHDRVSLGSKPRDRGLDELDRGVHELGLCEAEKNAAAAAEWYIATLDSMDFQNTQCLSESRRQARRLTSQSTVH